VLFGWVGAERRDQPIQPKAGFTVNKAIVANCLGSSEAMSQVQRRADQTDLPRRIHRTEISSVHGRNIACKSTTAPHYEVQ
jgi:hypothetical protein